MALFLTELPLFKTVDIVDCNMTLSIYQNYYDIFFEMYYTYIDRTLSSTIIVCNLITKYLDKTLMLIELA